MKKPQHNRHNPRRRRGPERREDHHHGHPGHPEARNPDDARGDDADDDGGRQAGPFRLASALDDAPELADNELAAKITQGIDAVRPHLNTILGIAAAAALAVAAFTVVSAQREAARARSWEAYLQASDRGDANGLEGVIRQHPDTDAARWASVALADFACATGADLLFADKPQAEKELDAAIERYSAILRSRPRGLLAERATFGLAKARESRGQLAEARQGYEAVARDHAGGSLAALATTRAKDLGRDTTRQWYDWFASASFAPPKPPAAAPVAPQTEPSPQPPSAGPATEKSDAPAPSKAADDAPPQSPPPAAGAGSAAGAK